MVGAAKLPATLGRGTVQAMSVGGATQAKTVGRAAQVKPGGGAVGALQVLGRGVEAKSDGQVGLPETAEGGAV